MLLGQIYKGPKKSYTTRPIVQSQNKSILLRYLVIGPLLYYSLAMLGGMSSLLKSTLTNG